MSKASKAVNKRYFLLKIKRKYILRQIFENLQNKRKLGIIKYNQNIQKRLQVILNDKTNIQKQKQKSYQMNINVENLVKEMEKISKKQKILN